jgi:hypothetical protein
MSDPQTAPPAPMTEAEVAASNIPPDPVGEPATEPVGTPDPVHPIHTVLDDIEALAIFWGGETMTELRNLVARGRALL